MNKRRVKLDDLQEGMKVAVEVKNMDDMLLIPAGCELTGRHIRILQTWGITEVSVESTGEEAEAVDPLKQVAPEVLERLTVEVQQACPALDMTQPVQAELFRILLARKVRRLFANPP